MIKHLFKLIWNRKRANFLMIMEIFISFFVLFIALVTIYYNVNNYFKPLGFSYDDVWRVSFDTKNVGKEEITETVRQFENIIKSYPQVEHVSLANSLLFFPDAMSYNNVKYQDRTFRAENLYGGDDFDKVLRINLVKGRWFDESDNAANISPVVINRKLKEKLFLDEDPIGKIIKEDDDDELRVVGLIDEFRRAGELTGTKPVLLRRLSLETEAGQRYIAREPFNRIYVKVKPGTGMDFEAKLLRQLTAVGKNFSVTVRKLEEVRDVAFKKCLVLPGILMIISGFFITNVALGMFGVIWYSINRRRGEIGLRRALGSPAKKIYLQILGEVFVLSTFGIVIGSFFAAQFPLLNLLSFIDQRVYLVAFVVSVLFIYTLSFVCALYPSKLASTIQPAVALHEE